MEVTVIDKHQSLKRNSSLTVRPFVNTSSSNMGLERYEMALFEGVFHEESVACLEYNGIKRYVTGLNEFAPEVKMIEDLDKREAVIKDIRTTVAQLERELASNVLDINDPDFWNKVKLLRPDNDDFWGKITMRFGNEPVYLEPAKDPYDLIKLRAIEAGGFSIVAKSLEEARQSSTVKFYLDSFEETAAIKTEVKKMKNKAFAELQKLFDKNQNKLFYVCKVIDANSTQYKKSTPLDIMYDNMDKYISGESVDKDKRKTAQKFLEVATLDMETLKLRALIKDANFYKLVSTRGDGLIYHIASGTSLGKNPSDVLLFLKNPLNEDALHDITLNVEKYWNS